MLIADCRLPNERRPIASQRPFAVHSALRTPHSAFTLIELMVAIGLMAILLIMIATIFYQATQAFRVARASIEIHESARAALNALVNDLTAAEFSAYDNGVQGYFALSQGPTDPATGAYSAPPGSPAPVAANGATLAADTLTFTTLAPQPSARYAAPEAIEQLALVRYALEWDGGSATVPGSRTARPTFNLVKRVRFPSTNDPNLNMDQFNWQYLPMEYTFHTSPPLASNDPDVILDAAGVRYAQSEVIAFHVLSMNVRLFCLPYKTSETSDIFVEAGIASSGGTNSLTDTTKSWPPAGGSFSNLRIYAGAGAGQPLPPPALPLTITTAAGDTLTVLNPMNPNPASGSQYRVEGTLLGLTGIPPPGWYQRGTYNFFGPTYRPPAIVEVTLEMTDVRATRSFIFTQRFYIPASER